LRAVAIVTQQIYGININAAGLDTLLKLKIVKRIASQRAMISIIPNKGLRNPKKRNDHKMFKNI